MDSITHKFSLLCLGALVAAITACASNSASQCEATGVLCPAGTHCAAAQPICIADTNRCGDAHVDSDEECDDGNTKDGDGCSHECKIELCGNGRVDFGEVCDNGPSKNGKCMSCSADCKSFETCGDGVLDTACSEVCDDHNNVGGDGCSTECKSTEVCGNHIIDTDVGEVCDDGDKNGTPNDPCSSNCRSNLSCNNGIVDPGEECDRGTWGVGNAAGNNNNNDCRADCQFNRCGDGFADTQANGQRREDCDRGHLTMNMNSHNQLLVPVPTEATDCNIDCTTPSCGDGKINHHFTPPGAPGPEQCDPPSVANGCSATCRFEHCGNGVQDPGEECDNGTNARGSGCFECRLEVCGNGRIDPNEQCDDGNQDSGDGCSGGTLAQGGCKVEVCGDGIRNDIREQCDSGVGGTRTPSATCDFDCTQATCGDGIVNSLFTAPGAAGPEQCDPPSVANGCSATCRFEHCGNSVQDPGEECDNGTNTKGSGCFECRNEVCGNGRIDPNEQCDDGNPDSGDGCSGGTLALGGCQIEFCGDGIRNDIREQCDSGVAGTRTPSATCDFDCTQATCGDGIVNSLFTAPGAAGPEQCDPPSVANGCSATCRFEHCGNGVQDPGEECDNGTNARGSGCFECRLEVCGNGRIDPNEQCDDGNQDSGDGCSGGTLALGGCQIEFCGDGIRNDLREQCDSGVGGTRTPSATCDFDCTTAICGDGIVNPLFTAPGALGPEQCDPPSVANGCSATCRFEHCGNSVQDPGEECDNGTNARGSGCFECRLEVCGNGRIDPNEQCDDGNPDSGDGCSGGTLALGGCQIEFCGDGIRNDLREQCDSGVGGTRTPSATCDFDCTTAICGDGIVNPLFTAPGALGPEQCDPPSVANGCSATCRFEHCGNSVQDPGEECDNGTNARGSGCFECRLEVCGNGRIDPSEQCDDGNTDSGDGCSGGTLTLGGCKIEFCGDGTQNNFPHEQCDTGVAGAPTPSATCNINCTLPRCGDHIVNPLFSPSTDGPEQCDPPNPGQGCSLTCQFEHCGNGVKDPEEECDGTDFGPGGNPGGLTCSVDCHIQRCGNGTLDPLESCDDGNDLACGTCSADCKTAIAPAAATGLIFAAPAEQYATTDPLDSFVIGDGITAVTFTFTNTATGIGSIPFPDGATSSDMAQNIAAAINASGLRITASSVGLTGIVTLTNRQATSQGNTDTTNNVKAASFFLSAKLAGGAAGNCANTMGCLEDGDCSSNHCDDVSRTCTACTAAGDCQTNLCVNGQCQVCATDAECTAAGSGTTCSAGVCTTPSTP